MLMCTPSYWVCVFFQAEDGIRDPWVTGVQTCALPIYASDVIESRRRSAVRLADATRSHRTHHRAGDGERPGAVQIHRRYRGELVNGVPAPRPHARAHAGREPTDASERDHGYR